MNHSDTPTTRSKEESPLTITARFIRVLGRANKAEGEFLDRLVSEWDAKQEGYTTLQESTFDFVANSYGLNLLHMQDMEDQWPDLAEQLNEAFRILSLRSHEPVSTAVRMMLRFSRNGHLQELTDILNVVEELIQQEETDLEGARETLKNRPVALGKEIREAIQKHPEIIEGL
jgi:hypothetical protein